MRSSGCAVLRHNHERTSIVGSAASIRSRSSLFAQLVISDQSQNVLKARLYLAPNLFVQVYRNDRFDTTNLVLVHNDRRVFGRDQLSGQWHRHKVHTSDPRLLPIRGSPIDTIPHRG